MSLRPATISLLLLALAAGCSSRPDPRQGPAQPVRLRAEAGTYDGKPARRIVTPHYLIETTIEDDEFVTSLGQLMEGALSQYRRLAPDEPMSVEPMRCYVFADRRQWAQFTRDNAGADADIYLRINRGGYAVKDWYVAYFIGDVGTWSVAAHEGWHQYVARHFAHRPPPFLEEGLACMFEDVEWRGEPPLPRWDLSDNPTRITGLYRTVRRRGLIPLSQLAAMHAGQVVNTTPGRIEGFYAQSWAFARFLWDAEGGKYRPALQNMLADLAVGRPYGRGDISAGPEGTWDPRSAKPLLEHYLGKPLPDLDREYQQYVRGLVGSRTVSEYD